ncbi:Serine/threonine-protein phosphatase BSL2 [Babesia sp. Xinjiang]|uniref:Serine/threonine-protein phosphatase BSL2 n=1 Tax=Babesia sp. Xinjiang TaxID=462227 RepID=UPI000A240F08|nr:Serine/threonine-protein phosphatase BSL2 [Babesia sp. Xinjiang]ORM40083.1 Serine/threonine-protein phosphatase BSL2 [Babesia sp. Xinjiang]
MAPSDILPQGQMEHLDSEEFSMGLVTHREEDAVEQDEAEIAVVPGIMNLKSFGEGYRSTQRDSSSVASGSSKTSFMRWHSQGNLLMEMKREDARIRREAKSIIDSSSRSDSCEGEFGQVRPCETPELDPDEFSTQIHTLFFTPHSHSQPVNNDVVSFLLKTFRDMENSKLISAPFELTSDIEHFRGRIFEVMNREFNSVTLSEALITVAFNQYAGMTHPGYMTLEEYLAMMETYKGVFANDTMTRFVFDSMDRRRKLMISLNDFIAGMMACSPQAVHKVNNAAGRLRLQHIFRAYDVKRKGYLNREALGVMLAHIQQLERITNSLKVEGIASMNKSFSSMCSNGGLTELDDQGSGRTVEEMMDLIMSTHEDGFGYDAFYSCVENGLIKGSHLLLRSDKDFAEMVGQHLIYALGHVVLPSATVVANEELPPPENIKILLNETEQAPYSNDNQPNQSQESVKKPSLWSTSNSPRSPEAYNLAQSRYLVKFAQEDYGLGSESGRNHIQFGDSHVSKSARDPYNFSGMGSGRRPLFHAEAPKSKSLEGTNLYPSPQPFAKKYTPHKSKARFGTGETDYNFQSHGERTMFSGDGLASSQWLSNSKEDDDDVYPYHSGLRRVRPFETDLGAIPVSDETHLSPFTHNRGSNADCPSGWREVHKRADTDGVLGNVDHLGQRGIRASNLEFSTSADSTENHIEVPELVLPSSHKIVDQQCKDLGTSIEPAVPVEPSVGVIAGFTGQSGVQFSDNVAGESPSVFSGGDGRTVGTPGKVQDTELDIILNRRMVDLCRRYRARFIGFNSRMLSDYAVALKVFGGIYRIAFKCNNYRSAFKKFDWCSYNELLELCDVVSNIVKQETTVVNLQGTTQLHGPLNGNVLTLLESFNSLGWPLHGESCDSGVNKLLDAGMYAKGEATKLIFLGDMIGDVEGFSLETLMVLFSLKILFPYHVFLLRGGREARHRDYKSPLFREICTKLRDNARMLKLGNDEALLVQSAHELYHRIYDVFENLSLAACISERILCIHGSLSKKFCSLDHLSNIPKPIVISSSVKDDNQAMVAYTNLHTRNALFSSLSPVAYDGSEDQFHVKFTEDAMIRCLDLAGVSLLVTSGSVADCGYSYVYGDRVLQLGGCTAGGTYSAALLREQRSMHYFITHRSLPVSSLS